MLTDALNPGEVSERRSSWNRSFNVVCPIELFVESRKLDPVGDLSASEIFEMATEILDDSHAHYHQFGQVL